MTKLNYTGEQHSAPKSIMTYVNDTVFNGEHFRTVVDSNVQIKLKGNKYYVGKGKKRYLWLATRMGMPTMKDAPGIEIIQTYNLMNR